MTQQFFELVREMRKQQRTFFSAKQGTQVKQEALKRAKELEKQVDKMIESITSGQTQMQL